MKYHRPNDIIAYLDTKDIFIVAGPFMMHHPEPFTMPLYIFTDEPVNAAATLVFKNALQAFYAMKAYYMNDIKSFGMIMRTDNIRLMREIGLRLGSWPDHIALIALHLVNSYKVCANLKLKAALDELEGYNIRVIDPNPDFGVPGIARNMPGDFRFRSIGQESQLGLALMQVLKANPKKNETETPTVPGADPDLATQGPIV